ncbi:APOBEC1 complementation factor [Eumeta japonica]|uniref:APOBEC1 complementation factor n=1 Tax=Eumeta variegata TaxID=151549 RepID=A0A4C1T783_EUMVA|nr:APOBEC1 complementation factor [Eumeta japonica]
MTAQLAQNLLQLSKDTGYPIVQSNGQRKFGPPSDWRGPSPPRGCEVFIGKIPREILEDELVPLFSKVGKIYEFRLMMDFSGSNRGYSFVTYTTREEASAAIRILNNYEIRPNRYLGVVKSVDNCRLFIGKLPCDKTREDLLVELSKYVGGIVNVIMYQNCYNRNVNRGFAFVEFASHREAAMARRALVPGFFRLWNQEVYVDWAEPEPEVDQEIMKTVKILYIRNLMISTSQEKLQKIVEKIIGTKISHIKKIKDYAFVHFKERSHAEQAIVKLTGIEIDGSKIEVKWAKPVDREFYKGQKLRKGNAKFNFMKIKDGVSSPNDEGIGSTCVGGSSTCSSPDTMADGVKSVIHDEYDLAPAKLESICNRYNWGAPSYGYSKCAEILADTETPIWMCYVEIPYVGLPLFSKPVHIGPIHATPALTMRSAKAQAAENAIGYLEFIRDNTLWSLHAVQPATMQPPMAVAIQNVWPQQPLYYMSKV